uniref:DOMON domain-containing protein n=1 Tax=Plectus sambesii TaxID=2011161 RepID=A0A914VUA3_9BILA
MPTMPSVVQFFVLLSIVHVFGQKTQFNFKRRVSLNDKKNSAISWLSDDKSITIRAEYGTQGWLGFGFSPKGEMGGADIVIAWIDKNGKGQISDRHATSNGFPPADSKQDYKLLDSSKNATHTVITFHRLLKTGDKEDLDLTTNAVTNLIWAYNDMIPESIDAIDYHHSNRGAVRNVNLLSPKARN